ncbi:MAG: hypothetical protein FGM22_07300 [Burkholderiaceae bacterium]|nr:hypothetical protein [Burkholderiaceae bacterium]
MSYTKRYMNADKTQVGVYNTNNELVEIVVVSEERQAAGYCDDVAEQSSGKKPAAKATKRGATRKA